MNTLIAMFILILVGLLVGLIALEYDRIWRWIWTPIKSLFHLVNASLQIVVKQFKEGIMECWDWSYWAALIVWTYVWHNWLSNHWSSLWSWMTSWWH